MITKCAECGSDQVNLEGWCGDLHPVIFHVYPDSILLMTNAPMAKVKAAVKEFGERGEDARDPKNIDDIIRDMGFVCLACSTHGTIPEIIF